MVRWKNLSRFPQFLLILQAIFLVVCSVLYPIFARMEGISYRDSFLRYRAEGENSVYSGKVNGVPVTFTASPDKTLVFQSGDSTPVTYTVTEDPSAVPKDHEMHEVLTGVEIRRDGEILFRGGWYTGGGFDLLVGEDGTPISPTVTISYGDATASVNIAVSPKPVTPAITLAGADGLVYTGAAQTPSVTVRDGDAVVPAGEYEMYLSLYENEHTGAERAAMAPLFEFVAIHAFLLGARTGSGLAAALEGDQLSQSSAGS